MKLILIIKKNKVLGPGDSLQSLPKEKILFHPLIIKLSMLTKKRENMINWPISWSVLAEKLFIIFLELSLFSFTFCIRIEIATEHADENDCRSNLRGENNFSKLMILVHLFLIKIYSFLFIFFNHQDRRLTFFVLFYPIFFANFSGFCAAIA